MEDRLLSGIDCALLGSAVMLHVDPADAPRSRGKPSTCETPEPAEALVADDVDEAASSSGGPC